jgi:hypothetical protein
MTNSARALASADSAAPEVRCRFDGWTDKHRVDGVEGIPDHAFDPALPADSAAPVKGLQEPTPPCATNQW